MPRGSRKSVNRREGGDGRRRAGRSANLFAENVRGVRILERRGPVANRYSAAAALGLIDQPWSRAELLAVLRGSDEPGITAECRAALAESRDPEARQAVADWEEQNPHEPELGRFVSSSEMLLQNASERVRYEMDELRERVAALRDREPPKPV